MSENKKATVGAVARTNIIQRESYCILSVRASENLKEFLGVLLLRLAAGQAKPSGWQLFDRLLRQLYAVDTERFSGLQSTKSTQRVVR